MAIKYNGPAGTNPVLDVVRAARYFLSQHTADASNPGQVGSAYWALQTALQDFDHYEKAYHVVDIGTDDFTIQHPLTCRPNLFECTANEWVREHGTDDLEPGEYELLSVADGAQWEIGHKVS